MTKEEGFTKLMCDFLSSQPNVSHYTWMKDGSILQNETGKTLTLYNNEENLGQYSCFALNSVGNSSSEGIKDEGSSNSFINSSGCIILPATIGAICLLLLVLLAYAFWRKKHKRPTSTCKTESTYTDLRRSDITEIYSQLKPVLSADTVIQSDGAVASEYENVHRKNI
ncbi:uncharacterized protein [Phyllobates terribilis]